MIAKDIMTKDVINVSLTTSVNELAKILIRQRISGVPVTNDKGQIVGVVSEADIVTKTGKQVENIMNKQVITINEETSVEEIATLMTTHRIKRLLVTRGEKLLGIVSRADVVGAIASGDNIALHSPIYDL